MMGTSRTVACILVLSIVAVCHADDSPRPSSNAEAGPSVRAILREASELARKQDEHQHYWTQRVLLHIGEVQTRAGDFDGARQSILGSTYDYGRDVQLAELAKAVARNGNAQRAAEIVRLVRSDDSEDSTPLSGIEHLIATGDLSGASKAIKQLKSEEHRAEGLRKLAVAYAKSGKTVQATECFSLAVSTALELEFEWERVRALSETAEAQLSVGMADAAKATMRRLVDKVELKDAWAKLSALRQSAGVAAKANDKQAAQRLFRLALEAVESVSASNKVNALEQIAVDQAGVGFIDDALKTASKIEHSEKDFVQDSYRERALFAIAVAQLKAADGDGAVRTALAVKYFVQYRDDALAKVVDHHVAKRDFKKALATTEKFDNPSRRAAAILKVATAHAKSGDHKAAVDIAGRIELTRREEFPIGLEKQRFDYRLPGSWGVLYESRSFFTMASHHMWMACATEVATAARVHPRSCAWAQRVR
jgi:tetratricopeptide (TPR) repeat protein